MRGVEVGVHVYMMPREAGRNGRGMSAGGSWPTTLMLTPDC
jgi:hypothetical protein